MGLSAETPSGIVQAEPDMPFYYAIQHVVVETGRRPPTPIGSTQVHRDVSKLRERVWPCSAQFKDEWLVAYRQSMLSHETNENREQKNKKLMRKHTEPTPVPSGHAV
jgi:hypothetical protein